MSPGWVAPYRVLFPASFLCAFFCVALWPLGAFWGGFGPAFEPVVVWHVHELIFGFGGAAIGGYLLTALPGWTGQSPMGAPVLIPLALLWGLARICMALADYVSCGLLLMVNAGYFALLAGVIGHQLLRAHSFHKLGFFGAVVALGIVEFWFLRGTLNGLPSQSLAMVDPLLIGVVMLMLSIGLRAIPAFTANWLARQGSKVPETPCFWVMAVPQVLLGLAIVFRFVGGYKLPYFAMICAALVVLWLMCGWRTMSIMHNRLLLALHLAFLWLPVGLIAIGISGLTLSFYPMSTAIHAITIGGIAGLIMAIAGRAAAHNPDGEMRANLGFTLGVVLIWLATSARMAAPIFPGYFLVIGAAALWCLGWGAFLIGFLPAFAGPPRRPILSGRRNLAPIAGADLERTER